MTNVFFRLLSSHVVDFSTVFHQSQYSLMISEKFLSHSSRPLLCSTSVVFHKITFIKRIPESTYRANKVWKIFKYSSVTLLVLTSLIFICLIRYVTTCLPRDVKHTCILIERYSNSNFDCSYTIDNGLIYSVLMLPCFAL